MSPSPFPSLRKSFAILVAFLFLLGAVVACSPPAPTPAVSQRIILTTIHPLAMILREVAGERAQVRALLAPGASPHTYDVTPRDAREAERSLVLLYVSGDLDAWAADLPAPRREALLPLLPEDLIIPLDPEKHVHWEGEACTDPSHDHAHDHEYGAAEHSATAVPDPHIWTDPMVVRDLLPDIARILGEADPEGAAGYRQRAQQFAQRLDALDVELAAKLAPVRGGKVVQFHMAFQYMMHRYGLVDAGVVEPYPGREAPPRYLDELARRLKADNVRALFREPQLAPGPALAISEATGLPIFVLDPHGGTSELSSYEALMRHNAEVLLKALQ